MSDALRGKSTREGADALAWINDVDNEPEDLMETLLETTTARVSRAGDANSEIIIEMPPGAMALVIEHHANELAKALRSLGAIAGGDPTGEAMRELDVDQLYGVQGELDTAYRAVEVLLKSRPAAEWEEGDE
jgi:hypothetical protein